MKSFVDTVLPAMNSKRMEQGLKQVMAIADADSEKLAKEDPIQEYADNHLDPLWYLANE